MLRLPAPPGGPSGSPHRPEGKHQPVNRVYIRIPASQSLLNRTIGFHFRQRLKLRQRRPDGIERQSPRPNIGVRKVRVHVRPARPGKRPHALLLLPRSPELRQRHVVVIGLDQHRRTRPHRPADSRCSSASNAGWGAVSQSQSLSTSAVPGCKTRIHRERNRPDWPSRPSGKTKTRRQPWIGSRNSRSTAFGAPK